jgi:phospholipid/cholesterol/gamma-HCH transport system substrate-binding protein
MKTFSERNPLTIGLVGIAILVLLVVGALQYDKIPLFSGSQDKSAYFAELGGLKTGSKVQVSGMEVGEVTGTELEGNQVLVRFKIDKSIRLGAESEAAIKTETVLGSKVLAVIPRGSGSLAGPIPLDRTTSPYQLPDALGDLTTTISGLDTNQLSGALTTLATTFEDTPPDLALALDGVSRLSDTINARDDNLRRLLGDANRVTAVLSERSDQIAKLVVDATTLLTIFQERSTAIDQLMGNVSAVSQQLSGVVGDNREQIGPALDKLNSVLGILDRRKQDIQVSIKRLNSYAMSLGESVGSGPFFKAYLVNLLPGQFLQPFVDAAFADQGLDPAQLLPSQMVGPGASAPGQAGG